VVIYNLLSKFVLHIYFPMMPVKHRWRYSLIRKKREMQCHYPSFLWLLE